MDRKAKSQKYYFDFVLKVAAREIDELYADGWLLTLSLKSLSFAQTENFDQGNFFEFAHIKTLLFLENRHFCTGQFFGNGRSLILIYKVWPILIFLYRQV